MKRIAKMTVYGFILLLAVSGILAGCTTTSNPEAAQTPEQTTNETAASESPSEVTQAPPKVYKIGFSSPLASLQFMKDLETGMGEAAAMLLEEANIQVEFTTADAKGAVENTVSDIETFIAQKVDMIITVNTSPATTAQLIEEAHEAGIKFCVAGATVGTEDLHVGVPDYQGEYDVAYSLGMWIKENFNSEGVKAKVIIVQNTTTETMKTRTKGSIDGLNASGCDWELAQSIDVTKGTADEALPLVTDAITANSDVNVFITSNDNTAMACLEASKQAGMNPEDYVIAGYGLETPSIPTFLSDGTPYRFSYAVPAVYGGNMIMHACVAYLEGIISSGSNGEPYELLLPGFVPDAETLEKYYNEQADGTWLENASELRTLFLQDDRYKPVLELAN